MKKSSYLAFIQSVFGLYEEFPKISRIRLEAMREEY